MSRPDAELIAKLLEGRATDAERRAILESADADADALALLADSAALREATAAPGWRRMLPSRANMPMYAIAATLLLAIGVPTLMRARVDVPPFNSTALDAKSVVAGAASGSPGQSLRGGSTGTRLQLSAWIGALTTDLDVLVRAGDSSSKFVVLQLAAAARTIPGGAAAASQLEGLKLDDARARTTAVNALAGLLDQSRFRAGKWTEAIRLAAAANSIEFLRGMAAGEAIDAIAGSRSLTPAMRQAALRVADALAKRAPAKAVEDAAASLLAELAR